MSELTLLVLRLGFLVLLWAFVFAIVYALRSDLFGQRVRAVKEIDPASAPAPAAPVAAPAAATGPIRSAPTPAPAPSLGHEVATTANARAIVVTSGTKARRRVPAQP